MSSFELLLVIAKYHISGRLALSDWADQEDLCPGCCFCWLVGWFALLFFSFKQSVKVTFQLHWSVITINTKTEKTCRFCSGLVWAEKQRSQQKPTGWSSFQTLLTRCCWGRCCGWNELLTDSFPTGFLHIFFQILKRWFLEFVHNSHWLFNGIYKYRIVLKWKRLKITMTNEYYLKTAFR